MTWYIDFIKAFFTFRVSYGVMLQIKRNFNEAMRRLRTSLRWLSRNWQMNKNIIFESPVPNFTQIGQEMSKLRVEIDLSVELKLLNRLSRNSRLFDKVLWRTRVLNFLKMRQRWYYVSDGGTDMVST